MEETVVKSVCRGCHGVCGVNVHLRDGLVVKVTGGRDCPTSLGYICAKCQAAPQLLYHPDRLKYPPLLDRTETHMIASDSRPNCVFWL
jgi:anaerobic selenocysteine-containing dehydrogenase